ncbi:MAG: PEGA domain-containing protein [Myxococcota bacterium]
MSNQGKGPPQNDDRTILDPLNADELKALREAREKFQKQQGKAGAGPDMGQDIGDAPTRALNAIPQFNQQGPSLNNLSPSPKIIADPKPLTPQSARIPTGTVPQGGHAPVPHQSGSSHPGVPQPAAGQPQPGQPGFGENTLMWMAPVKVETAQIIPERGEAAAGGMRITQAPPEPKGAKTMRMVIAGGVVVIIGTVAAFILGGGSKTGQIELVTTPPKAAVSIDGEKQEYTTPLRASLKLGQHVILLELDGFKPETVNVDVQENPDPTKPQRKQVDLTPISKPGLLTVAVEVQPVAANITLDGETFPGKKTVKVANIDPQKAHKIVVEVGGYAKIENEIPAGQLKDSYNFILQPDPQK